MKAQQIQFVVATGWGEREWGGLGVLGVLGCWWGKSGELCIDLLLMAKGSELRVNIILGTLRKF